MSSWRFASLFRSWVYEYFWRFKIQRPFLTHEFVLHQKLLYKFSVYFCRNGIKIGFADAICLHFTNDHVFVFFLKTMATGSRPKYRNADGCCICRRKSSSSRFAGSKEYEMDFEECFLLGGNQRSGRICNACVLIIKRFRAKKDKNDADDMNFSHVSTLENQYDVVFGPYWSPS